MTRGAGINWAAALMVSAALHGVGFLALPHLTDPDRPPAQAAPDTRARFQATRVAQSTAKAQTPQGAPSPAQTPKGQGLSDAGVPESRAQSLRPAGTTLSATDTPRTPLPPGAVRADPLPEAAAQADAAPALRPPSAPTPPRDAPTMPATRLTPAAQTATARPVWQFGDRIVSDPASLAVIQAFLPEAGLETDATQMRDTLNQALSNLDCARVSARFDAETGALILNGHVPDPDMRAPVLAAMQAQVGPDIRVTGDLLHLPRPQCGALSGIAAVGLPQSTDQLTDTRLVGAAAHAREYRYAEGQRLGFDLTAPDYDAVVYVDYFDADGQVIHLVPSALAPLQNHRPESLFGVGRSGALNITIGPPFGQEIAVAFAASRPLYDGLRPLREPAAPYLAFLKAQVAAARAADPAFKGEWVYFFVTTRAATQ